jgi:hypothetical protein
MDGSSDASGDDGKALFARRGDACENTASKDISREESDRSGEREKSVESGFAPLAVGDELRT